MKINFDNLPAGMTMPHELELLFEWIDEKNYYGEDGTDWLSDKEGNGTAINFFKQDESKTAEINKYYEETDRLYVFATCWDDIALWIDDKGETKIVSMGISDAQSLFCVIGDALDFIRLLAIGYSWITYFYDKSNFYTAEDVSVNHEFQAWVVETFNTTIPKNAHEIIPNFITINDLTSDDPFWQWDREHNTVWETMKYTIMVLREAQRLFLVSISFNEYSTGAMPIMFEIRSWLEQDDVDCGSEEVKQKVKEFSNFCLTIKQPEDDRGCHIFTAYTVALLEHLFSEKLHILVPFVVEKKEYFIKDKEFYRGYCSVSEEMYQRVLKLF